MTIRSTTFFTPQTLLSFPRRSPGVPNSDASLILFTSSSYSFEEHEQKLGIYYLDARTNEQTTVSFHKEARDPVWLDDGRIAYLRGLPEEGKTEVVVVRVREDRRDE